MNKVMTKLKEGEYFAFYLLSSCAENLNEVSNPNIKTILRSLHSSAGDICGSKEFSSLPSESESPRSLNTQTEKTEAKPANKMDNSEKEEMVVKNEEEFNKMIKISENKWQIDPLLPYFNNNQKIVAEAFFSNKTQKQIKPRNFLFMICICLGISIKDLETITASKLPQQVTNLFYRFYPSLKNNSLNNFTGKKAANYLKSVTNEELENFSNFIGKFTFNNFAPFATIEDLKKKTDSKNWFFRQNNNFADGNNGDDMTDKELK